MGFFDEDENMSENDIDSRSDGNENNEIPKEDLSVIKDDPEQEEYKLPKGAKTADEIGADFWKGASEARRKRSEKGRTKRVIARLCFMVVFVCIGIGISMVSIRGGGWLSNILTGGKNINFTLPVADRPELDEEYYQPDGRYTAEGVAKAQSPSVVSIEIYKKTGTYIAAGQGSGVIMSADGYIVTNAHVVSDAEEGIKVILSDSTEYEAKVVGVDAATDIAVIKIAAQGLQPAEFGDSAQVKQGEDVVTIGSPAGYYGTVTKGVVSGVNRRIRLENSSIIMNCIQIDAAINPGNSGGALFNMWGQVIGITSSKLASNDYEGIGFAISVEEAKPVIEELMEKGFVDGRVKIGITYYTVSKTTAEMYGIAPGLCVVSVNPECDVANTQLAEGDIITEIDGRDVMQTENISELFADKKAGDEITCHVYRHSYTDSEDYFDITFKLMEDNGGLIPEESDK